MAKSDSVLSLSAKQNSCDLSRKVELKMDYVCGGKLNSSTLELQPKLSFPQCSVQVFNRAMEGCMC